MKADNLCDRCSKVVHTEFSVPDVIWTQVTGHHRPVDEYAAGYWCIPCFIEWAERIFGSRDFTMEVHVRRHY